MLKPGEKTQRVITVLVTWGILLAVFGVYEWSFVRTQKEFLEKQAFQTLAAVAGGLNAKVERAQKSAASFLKLVATGEPEPRLYSYLDIYLDIQDQTVALETIAAARMCASPAERPKLALGSDRLVLTIYCRAGAQSGHHNHAGKDKAPSNDKSPKESTVSSDQPKASQKDRVALVRYDITPNVSTFSGLDGQADIFDDVLIADPTGRVLYQNSQIGPRIANLKSFVGENNQANEATQKTEQQDPPSDSQSSPPVGPALHKLTQASAVTDITVADVNYKLFSQPFHLPLGSSSDAGKATDLLVCALVNAGRFDKESHAIPYSKGIWAAMIGVLLFSLSWPLFKLRFMSDTERFGVKDGWLLILAIFLVTTSGTLMLLHLSYTIWATESEDRALKHLAYQMKGNFDIEMMAALAQLQQLRPVAGDLTPVPAPAGSQEARVTPVLVADYLESKIQPTCYPFFEAAFWTDKAGQQILRLDIRGASTPAIDVSSTPYFQAVKATSFTPQPHPASEESLRCPDSRQTSDFDYIFDFNHVYVHPVLSPNTDDFSLVLADPRRDLRLETSGIEALAMKPMSLVNPVLPPGYGFAVIDGECEVLFHSQSFRNMRENFCQESKDSYELKPVLLSGVDTHMDVSYLGQTERAYVTEITSPHFAAGPAFLIVFRLPGVRLTLDLAIILVCSILLGAYFALFVLIALLHLGLRRPLGLVYPPEFIWPQQRKALSYLELLAANCVMLFAFLCFYRHLFEAPLLAMTLALPSFSVLFLVLKLSTAKEKLLPVGVVLFVVGAVVFITALVLAPGGILLWPRSGLSALPAWGLLLLLVGATAVLLSGRLPWHKGTGHGSAKIRVRLEKRPPGWLGRMPRLKEGWIWLDKRRPQLREVLKKHYGMAYTLMGVSVIAAVAIVPCLGFFKYSYDVVSELSLKHDQLALSESLLDRRDRIRTYYEQIKVPEGLVQDRLDRVLDLYHMTYYQSTQLPAGQSRLFTVCWNCTATQAENESAGNRAENLNDLIEKRLAAVTLNLPSNRLGAEMSKLGLSSTDDKLAWEHSWAEPRPWRFRLAWKSTSRMPNLQIMSEYLQWNGLQWWAYWGLGLLLAILAAWLMSLAKTIFFIGVEAAPPYEEVNWESVTDIKMDYLLIGHAKSGKSEWLESILKGGNVTWLDARLELKQMIENSAYKVPVPKCDVLVLDHFDYNLWDATYNEKRLELLESLVYETDAACKLVVASTVDPLYFLTEGSPHVFAKAADGSDPRRLLDRWARALSKFKRGRPKEPVTRLFIDRFVRFIERHRKEPAGEFVIWVCAECNCTAMLRRIGMDLFEEFRESEQYSREGVVSTVLDRSDSYYHVLWTSLTFAERLVLYQLALDGWTNAKNRDTIQQLERKQLIYKGPMYRIMNESFRRFIESTEHEKEILKWQGEERASTWHAFRAVLIVAALGVAVWMLYTQAALSQTVIGIIAGSATLLTAVGGLLGRLKSSKASNGG